MFLNHFLISKDESGDGSEDESEDNTVEKGNWYVIDNGLESVIFTGNLVYSRNLYLNLSFISKDESGVGSDDEPEDQGVEEGNRHKLSKIIEFYLISEKFGKFYRINSIL